MTATEIVSICLLLGVGLIVASAPLVSLRRFKKADERNEVAWVSATARVEHTAIADEYGEVLTNTVNDPIEYRRGTADPAARARRRLEDMSFATSAGFIDSYVRMTELEPDWDGRVTQSEAARYRRAVYECAWAWETVRQSVGLPRTRALGPLAPRRSPFAAK